jgi:formylglycine-generating enzyme required for sulfatase activity
VSWYDAALFCNALSVRDGLQPCYGLDCEHRGHPCSSGCEKGDPVVQPFGPGCSGYRLPSESEWEYAARAGDGRATYAGEALDEIAWFQGNSDFRVHEVGTLRPNAWGLHDMLGNLAEWCWDARGSYPTSTQALPAVDPFGGEAWAPLRVERGGAYGFAAANVRAAARFFASAEQRHHERGFRPVRTVVP